MGVEEDAYITEEEDQNEMILDLLEKMDKLDDLSVGRDIVFQPLIGKKESDRIKKHSPLLYEEILTAITDRSYKFYQKTKTTKDKDGKKKTVVVKDDNPQNSVIYLDKSKPSMPVLRIDLFKRFGGNENYKRTNAAQIEHKPSVAKKHQSALYGIRDFLRGYGFSAKVNAKNLSASEIEFPASFKMKVDGQYRTFRLRQVASRNRVGDKLHYGTVNSGFYAAYIMDTAVGSPDAWGASYMFPGTLPTLKQINDFNKAKAAVEGQDVTDGEEVNVGRSNYDEDTDSYEEVLVEQERRSTTEEEILVEVDSSEETNDGEGIEPPSSGLSMEGLSKNELSESVKEKIAKTSAELGAILENPTTQEEKETSKKLNDEFDGRIDYWNGVIQQLKGKIELAPIKAKEQIEKKPEDKDFVEEKLEQMLAKFNKELSDTQEYISILQKKNSESVTAFIMKVVKIVQKQFKGMNVNDAANEALQILKNC